MRYRHIVTAVLSVLALPASTMASDPQQTVPVRPAKQFDNDRLIEAYKQSISDASHDRYIDASYGLLQKLCGFDRRSLAAKSVPVDLTGNSFEWRRSRSRRCVMIGRGDTMLKTLSMTTAAVLASVSQPCLAQTMRHPGAFDSAGEFQVRAAGIPRGVQPWAADFAKMRSNAHDRPDYVARPVPGVVRGRNAGQSENYAQLFNDTAAAYALALDWRLTGDVQRGAAAARILTAWGRTIQSVQGTSDRYLASGIYGYQLAVAGETLRDFSGWRADDRQAFRDALLRVFAPMNQDFLEHHNGASIDHYWANWDLANTASLMAIGVFADRPDLYASARDYYLHGAGNGAIDHAAWKVYPGGLAQWQESGRDQGHTLLGIGLAGAICEIAWHQGDDLFAANGNRLLAAARYAARYNLGQDVPYTTFHDSLATQPVISPDGRGQARPVWALIYGHYVGRRHLAAPEIAAIMRKDGLEGGGGDYGPNSGGFDQLGYGTLTFLQPGAVARANDD